MHKAPRPRAQVCTAVHLWHSNARCTVPPVQAPTGEHTPRIIDHCIAQCADCRVRPRVARMCYTSGMIDRPSRDFCM